MKRILIYYKSFNPILGGSDYLPLMLIAYLQRYCDITLALNWKSDLNRAALLCGLTLDLSHLKVKIIKPNNRLLRAFDTHLPFYRTWQLKKLAQDADICISTANIMDFGKPAHQFICSLDFGDTVFLNHVRKCDSSVISRMLQHIRTVIAEYVIRPILRIRSPRKIISSKNEHIYPNSFFVQRAMQEFYGSFTNAVFYPPTPFTSRVKSSYRDPLKVVCIGRISPEKRIEDIIDIVDHAREKSALDLKLEIAGMTGKTPYASKLSQIAASKRWISFVGAVYGNDKEVFLNSATYAVHTERDEAFGIAVTEYLKAGLIPIVPNEGGTPEVVDSPDLTYHTNEEGAQILVNLLDDTNFRERVRTHCAKRAKEFSCAAYLQRQHKLLDKILRT